MTYLLFILGCFGVAILYWIFKMSLLRLWLMLFAFGAIGLLIIPIDFEIGVIVIIISVGLMVVIFFLGLIGIGVATIVAAPFLLLYGVFKSIFNK